MGSVKKRVKIPNSLTKFDLEVEHYIRSFLLRENVSPSQRNIAEHFEKSLSSIQFSLQKLIHLKRLEKSNPNGRELIPLQPKSPAQNIPLLGRVAAGLPIEAIEQHETLEVPAWMMKANAQYFVLQVQGQSMIEDSIQNGDFVLIRQTQTANTGDTVVALINNEATLKRYEKKSGRIRLLPANSTMNPIEIEAHQELRIAGIFAGVLRKGE